jgi:hypothetical protein
MELAAGRIKNGILLATFGLIPLEGLVAASPSFLLVQHADRKERRAERLHRPTAVSSESGNHRGEFALTDCRRASRQLSRWRDIGTSKDSIPSVSRAARLAGYNESVCEEKATATTTCAQTYR